jgi:hypothetical protein
VVLDLQNSIEDQREAKKETGNFRKDMVRVDKRTWGILERRARGSVGLPLVWQTYRPFRIGIVWTVTRVKL